MITQRRLGVGPLWLDGVSSRIIAQHQHPPKMPDRTLPALFSIVLLALALGGCGTIEKDKKANAMDAALATYGEAIRWGYFETAYGYVHPDEREEVPKHLDNIRVTGYEVVQPPIMKDEGNAEQMVRIEYIHRDRQVLRSLSDRQLWRYAKDTNNWWLHSGVPEFK